MPRKPDEGSRRQAPVEPAAADGTGACAPALPAETRYDDPDSRARHFRLTRAGADQRTLRGTIASGSAAKRAQERRVVQARAELEMPAPPGGPGSVNWVNMGPQGVRRGMGGAASPVVSGRVTSVAVGPGGQRAYVGAANGGVWVTENGGNSWSPLDEFAMTPAGSGGGISSTLEADSLAVGAVAVKFGPARSSDVLFVGTGEPGGDGYFGVGIKVSTDGGATFRLEATNLASMAFYRIAIDPDDPTLVFAATSGGLYQRPRTAPFTQWVNLWAPLAGMATDVVVAGKGAQKTYFAARTVADVSEVWSGTTPSIGSWARTPLNGSGRVALAAGENDPRVAYALVADGTLHRRDASTGGAFTKVAGVPRALFAGNQGDYDLAVAADPLDADTVYLIGDLTSEANSWALSIYKGKIATANGQFVFPFNAANDQTRPGDATTTSRVQDDPTWIGSGIHPDGHALGFATRADGSHDGAIVWLGTDGGVFVSTASGARGSFAGKNETLSITEMTFLAQHPSSQQLVFGGTQDNGTIGFDLGQQAWFEAGSGDGGGVAIDPQNPARIVRQYTKASLSISMDGGNTWADAAPVPGDSVEAERTAFYSPLKAFAANAQTAIAFGTNRLWVRSDWGQAWQSLPSGTPDDVLDDPHPNDGAWPRAPITALAFASATRLFAATSGNPPGGAELGRIWRFDHTGAGWSKQALPPLPSSAPALRAHTALWVEHADAGTVYVTLGSGGGEHVFYFDGTAWVDTAFSAKTQVDVPTHAVVVDPDMPLSVYVGTDVGVWHGTRSGASWSWVPFSQGLPEAAVTDLGIHAPSRRLVAATHGRGIWSIALPQAAASPFPVFSPYPIAMTPVPVGDAWASTVFGPGAALFGSVAIDPVAESVNSTGIAGLGVSFSQGIASSATQYFCLRGQNAAAQHPVLDFGSSNKQWFQAWNGQTWVDGQDGGALHEGAHLVQPIPPHGDCWFRRRPAVDPNAKMLSVMDSVSGSDYQLWAFTATGMAPEPSAPVFMVAGRWADVQQGTAQYAGFDGHPHNMSSTPTLMLTLQSGTYGGQFGGAPRCLWAGPGSVSFDMGNSGASLSYAAIGNPQAQHLPWHIEFGQQLTDGVIQVPFAANGFSQPPAVFLTLRERSFTGSFGNIPSVSQVTSQHAILNPYNTGSLLQWVAIGPGSNNADQVLVQTKQVRCTSAVEYLWVFDTEFASLPTVILSFEKGTYGDNFGHPPQLGAVTTKSAVVKSNNWGCILHCVAFGKR